MTHAAKPTDVRRLRTVEALMGAAEAVFAGAAFADVTVEEISERAGVAVGSIYNNFGSKAGLYSAVVDRALDVDREYMDRAYTPDRTPIEQLEEAARQYLRFYLDYPEFFRMLAFPAETGSYAAAEQAAHRLVQRVDEQNARMVEAIDRGVAEGSLRPVDSRRAATVLWASWNGVISLGWRPDELREQPDALGELLTLAADMVAWGLRIPGNGPQP